MSYINVIVLLLGESFVYGHVVRAIHFRLLREEALANSLALPDGFRVVSPTLVRTDIGSGELETEKSSALAVAWYLGAKKADVIDGTTGKFVEE